CDGASDCGGQRYLQYQPYLHWPATDYSITGHVADVKRGGNRRPVFVWAGLWQVSDSRRHACEKKLFAAKRSITGGLSIWSCMRWNCQMASTASANWYDIRARSRSSRWMISNRCCLDRKSTRLNSSHVKISYAVFCLKK